MIAKVFILYTGGTIGMVPSIKDNPYSPLKPAPLAEILNFVPGFNSNDIANPQKAKSAEAQDIAKKNQTLKQQADALPEGKKRDDAYKKLVPFIELENGNVIVFGSDSFAKPVDSSDVGPNDWNEMAKRISAVYKDYDGFVILHGTDTMAYTSSALSFIFENLAKPVVITGSQLPIAGMRTDAVLNFINAIYIAGYKVTDLPLIPEVVIAFADKVIRGCRASKMSTADWAGFDSPNFPLIGTIGEHIKVNTSYLMPVPTGNKQLFIKADLQPKVSFITLFPGFSQLQIEASLQDKDIDGYILRTYGTGNVPGKQAFLDAIASAVKKGKVIINVTQCPVGSVEMGLYEASSGLLERGVISGLDMTPEAAVVKMMWTLGTQYGDGRVTQMQINQRGEQTENLFDLRFGGLKETNNEYINSISPDGRLDRNRISNAMLHISGFAVEGAQANTEYELRVFMNMPNANHETSVEEDRCVAVLHYSFGEDETVTQTLMRNITYKCHNVIGSGDVILKLVSADPNVKFTFGGLFIALYVKT